MNAQTTIDAPGQAVATFANIDELCEGRNRALAHWLAAYDGFHTETRAAGLACIGRAFLSIPPGNNRYDESTLAADFLRAPDQFETERLDGWKEVKTPAREVFERSLTRELDRSAWQALLDLTGGGELMDRQAKEEWRASLKDPAPFTPENCKATFAHLWGNRRELFLRGIANTFSRLDRRFRSHDGFKIGARLIIDGGLDTDYSAPHWKAYERRDTFEDVERLLYELDGKPYPSRVDKARREDGEEWPALASEAVTKLSRANLPEVVTGPYFRVRVFKNGNLHIWFEREDLLREVNRLLAEYYGEAIGDGHNETEAHSAPEYHLTPAKNFGAFNTSPELAKRVAGFADIHKGQSVLEPSAGTGELAKAARALGGDVRCMEIQPGLAHELAQVHGFRTWNGDFLKATPADLGTFDLVLMNPPFDRGRDCDHVRHAWQFVKPGGKLIAIMSARAEYGEDSRHKALHRLIEGAQSCYGRESWHDLPPGSFAHAGTQVNTVALTLRKPAT
jgi:predicted RNA methylase